MSFRLFTFQPAPDSASGSFLVRWLNRQFSNLVVVLGQGDLATTVATITYSASMTPDVPLGRTSVITATTGAAFTINAPGQPAMGGLIRLRIVNASGGALGVITWNAIYKRSAWTSPANGFHRTIEFQYDGTNWGETMTPTVDVPN